MSVQSVTVTSSGLLQNISTIYLIPDFCFAFQTNLYMSRELAALKAQMQEMKNMMKVSFDLQLDIQRAIRQEVAAGLAAAMASNGESLL